MLRIKSADSVIVGTIMFFITVVSSGGVTAVTSVKLSSGVVGRTVVALQHN